MSRELLKKMSISKNRFLYVSSFFFLVCRGSKLDEADVILVVNRARRTSKSSAVSRQSSISKLSELDHDMILDTRKGETKSLFQKSKPMRKIIDFLL